MDKKEIKRVFVSGPYSADNILSVLNNMRIGLRACTEIMVMGYTPHAPWLNFLFHLMLQGMETLGIENYYKYSIDWLEVSDVMVVIGTVSADGKISSGVKNEIDFAEFRGIPVFYGIRKFKKYIKELEK